MIERLLTTTNKIPPPLDPFKDDLPNCNWCVDCCNKKNKTCRSLLLLFFCCHYDGNTDDIYLWTKRKMWPPPHAPAPHSHSLTELTHSLIHSLTLVWLAYWLHWLHWLLTNSLTALLISDWVTGWLSGWVTEWLTHLSLKTSCSSSEQRCVIVWMWCSTAPAPVAPTSPACLHIRECSTFSQADKRTLYLYEQTVWFECSRDSSCHKWMAGDCATCQGCRLAVEETKKSRKQKKTFEEQLKLVL